MRAGFRGRLCCRRWQRRSTSLQVSGSRRWLWLCYFQHSGSRINSHRSRQTIQLANIHTLSVLTSRLLPSVRENFSVLTSRAGFMAKIPFLGRRVLGSASSVITTRRVSQPSLLGFPLSLEPHVLPGDRERHSHVYHRKLRLALAKECVADSRRHF